MHTRVWGLVLAAAVMGPNMALAGPCDTVTETVYALTAPVERVDGEPVLGRSAFACGRYWSAANLMEKATIQRGSVLQRFNLAATYAQTGRYDQAEALYRSVVEEGDYVRARSDSSPVRAGDAQTGFGLASEAARRLAALQTVRRLFDGPATTVAAAAGGPVLPRTAEQAATNAGTVEGGTGPTAADGSGIDASALEGGISDAEALRRDGLLEPG